MAGRGKGPGFGTKRQPRKMSKLPPAEEKALVQEVEELQGTEEGSALSDIYDLEQKLAEARDSMSQELLDAVIGKVRLPNGKALQTLGTMSEKVSGVIDTGCIGLNEALGVHGWPRGRVVEVYGDESSGKTTLALHAVAQVQKAGGVAAFIDAEHALDPKYATALGVNVNRLIFDQPDGGGEGALQTVEALLDSGGVDLIVVDSVAALVPLSELESDIGDVQPGAQARLMSQALRKITPKVKRADAVLLFLNQMRDKIGVKYGSPKTTSGGNALKFYASVRIEVTKIGGLKKGDDDRFGNRVRFKVVKCKVAPPFKAVEVDILFGKGISRLGEIIDYGHQLGIIQKAGAWYSYGQERLGQGKDNTVGLLEKNPELAKTLEKLVAESLSGVIEAGSESE